MKKFVIFLVMGTFFLASCNQDDDSVPGEENTKNQPEQDKENLEQSAVDMVKEMDELSSQTGIEASVHFTELVETNDPFSNGDLKSTKDHSFWSVIHSLADFSKREGSATDVFNSLKSTNEDTTSSEKSFNKITATYTWDHQEQRWDSSGNANALVFKFPATESSNTNNAVFTFDTYQAKYVTVAQMNDSIESPTNVGWNLKVDNKEVMSYTYTADFNSDGIPASVYSQLKISDFKYVVDYSGGNQSVDLTYSLTKGNNVLLELHGESSGDWSPENIEDNTYTFVDSSEYYYKERDSVAFGNIVKEGNAYFQVMDIKLVGNIDFENLWKRSEELNNEPYTRETKEKRANAIDKYTKLQMQYANSGDLIANAETYVEREIVTIDHFGESFTDTTYNINMRLVFADKSKSDLETYFDEGFADLETEMNEFIRNMNDQYDADMEEVEF